MNIGCNSFDIDNFQLSPSFLLLLNNVSQNFLASPSTWSNSLEDIARTPLTIGRVNHNN